MAKQKKIWEDKKCKKCKKIFTPVNNRQIFCGFPCSSPKLKTIAEANAAWLTKDPNPKRKPPIQINLKNYGCRVI